MRGSAGSARPSVLAMNPDNVAASAARRVQLLAAFSSLDEDTQADLLEAVETLSFSHSGGYDPVRATAREIIRKVYVAAGWPPDPS